MMTLIAFGTEFGSTEKVALEIASVLRKNGHRAEVMDLREHRDIDLERYGLVVIGSGIVCGSWSKEALRFLEMNSMVLREKRLAMFACCGDLMLDPSRKDEYRRRYLQDVADRYGLRPVRVGLFGGVLDFSKHSYLVKGILDGGRDSSRGLERRGIDPKAPYDLRDWNAIRKWASDLEGVL
ncbi:MAG: flavodoxin domain-containing protein [Methanomassiliicoccus sp.]|nr:flavodoxin domain-containing protein [Methanomassiliicoccus sp.]